MTQLSKEFFVQHLGKEIRASEKRMKKYVDTKFGAVDKEISALDKRFDDQNQYISNAFTGVQTQLNSVQRQLNDANLPQIKRDHKLIKSAIGLSA